MANLIFKGHATRGEELHKLLEYLGGLNSGYETCSCVTSFYYINREGYIEGSSMIPDYMNHRIIMSLETFESTYPYKIDDFVMANDGTYGKIIKMGWDEYSNTIKYTFKDGGIEKIRGGYTSNMLKLMETKKEAIKTKADKVYITRLGFNSEECEICLSDDIKKDYELKFKDGKLLCVKKKPQYPKTYEECCEVLGIEEDLWFVYEDIDANHINPACISNYRMRRLDLYHNLEKLIICRDAYWKIVGDWKPDWLHNDIKYILDFNAVTIYKDAVKSPNYVLAFPTEEMRDAFYENFKELIESCKELL